MTQQQPTTDTPFYGTQPQFGGNYYKNTGSELRALCVKIAIAKSNNEDITAEQLYEQMRTSHHHHYYYYEHNDAAAAGADDDTFSSTPMDDEYTQRRMGMMRQMS